jgi:CRISPR type II-A-associated protein Csn2
MLIENQVNVLCVENPECFTAVVRDLWLQRNGGQGAWILSEGAEAVPIAKRLEIIINPLAVDCNYKRILKVLYQEMNNDLQEKYFDRYTEANAAVVNLLSKIMEEQPYPLEMELEVAPVDLFKLYNLHFDMECSDLCDQLIFYIKIWHQVGHVDNYVFVNLKSYLNEKQYIAFCEQAFYEKVHIVLVESRYGEQKKLDFETVKIVDRDLCNINL